MLIYYQAVMILAYQLAGGLFSAAIKPGTATERGFFGTLGFIFVGIGTWALRKLMEAACAG